MKFFSNYLLPGFLILGLLCVSPVTEEPPSVQEDLANQVLRFHVLANSDSDIDQSNKLLVRDAVMQEVSSYIKDCQTKTEVIAALEPHLETLADTAQRVLLEQGAQNTVSVKLENTFFPTKTYAGLTFPCGYYDALRIEIGAAQGHNWWCVMFPRLCFADLYWGYIPEESVNELSENLAPTTYESLITGKNTEAKPNIVFRFRFLEWFQ